MLISCNEQIRASTGMYNGKIILLFNVDIISSFNFELHSFFKKVLKIMQSNNFKVDVSCNLGFFIVVVFRSLRSIFICSNLIISFSELSFFDVII